MTANIELEQRVHDRTIRLNLVVDQLRREIIERQLAQQQLADREASLMDAQEIAEFGSYEVDVTTWIGRCSPTACTIFEFQNEEPFRDFRDFVKRYVHPEDVQRANQTRQTLFESGVTDEVEFRFLCPDGREKNLYGRRRVIRNADGLVVKIVGIVQDITERKRANAELLASRQRLKVLSRQLITTQEMERRHIARELHDELGQVLTAIKIHLWSTQQAVDANVRARFDESLAMIDRAIGQVRNLSLDLRPPQLEDLGLVATLHWYLRKQSEMAGFQQHLVAEPAEMQVPIELATTCFRITQEAVTNALRHAQPRAIHVELFQSDQELHLTIRDDGTGFDVSEAHERSSRGECLGLSGMQERVHLADGQIEIDSAMEDGTTIHAWFPLTSTNHVGNTNCPGSN